MSHYKPQILMLRPQDLTLDPEVQRLLSESRVKKMVAEWDEDMLGTIDVSRREDGNYYVTDGWHRVQSLIRMGRGAEKIACVVSASTGQKIEAKRFVAKNGKTRRPTPIDLYRVNLKAEDPEIVAIDKIVKALGLKVDNNLGNGVIQAASEIIKTYRAGGATLLRNVLTVIHNAWLDEPSSYHSNLIGALSLLLGNEDIDIDQRVLARKLAEDGTPERIVGKGRTLASVMARGNAIATAEVILGIYNKNKSSNRVKVVW